MRGFPCRQDATRRAKARRVSREIDSLEEGNSCIFLSPHHAKSAPTCSYMLLSLRRLFRAELAVSSDHVASLTTDDVVVIDPTGDVLLTLDKPGTRFAIWEQGTLKPVSNCSEQKKIEDTDAEDADEEYTGEEDAPRRKRKRTGTIGQQDAKRKHRDRSLSNASISTLGGETLIDYTPTEASKRAVVYQVSSRHLITASPKFQKELEAGAEDAIGEDGFYHLTTSGWDPGAFSILLNILHLRSREVPRELTLESLAKVAVLVDYYRCWEAFDLIAAVWVKYLRENYTVPATYSHDLQLWILVSWVFKLSDEFTDSTSTALRQSEEPSILDGELGIPPAILRRWTCD
jgi:hypothetical protein